MPPVGVRKVALRVPLLSAIVAPVKVPVARTLSPSAMRLELDESTNVPIYPKVLLSNAVAVELYLSDAIEVAERKLTELAVTLKLPVPIL